jgi:hypothetical protein
MKYFCMIALIFLATPCVAGDRDHKADLIIISARFVEVHSRTTHKAGDADEQFIEDVIIPSVYAVVDESGSTMTDAQRDAVIFFLLASENSASEEVSDIAATLYRSKRMKLCTSIAKLAQSKRAIVLDRIKNGIAATGKSSPSVICP